MCACVRVDACILNHSLCEHNTPHSSCRADCDSQLWLCDEHTRTHEVYRCTVHSRHQDRAVRTRSCWPRGALSLRGMPWVSALRLGAARLYESRAPALGATAATACSLPAATGARRVAVRRMLLMLLPRRAVVPPRGGTQLEGGVGDRRAGSLSSADAASRLGGGSCFAARVAKRRTRLRSAAAALSERGRWRKCWASQRAKTEEKRNKPAAFAIAKISLSEE